MAGRSRAAEASRGRAVLALACESRPRLPLWAAGLQMGCSAFWCQGSRPAAWGGGGEGRTGAGWMASQSRLQAFCRSRSVCVHTLQLILSEPEPGEWRVCVWGALFLGNQGASLLAQMVKNPPAMRETRVPPLWLGRSPGVRHDIPSSILAWRIPWTEEPGGLQSSGSQRDGHGSASQPGTLNLDWGMQGVSDGGILIKVKWNYSKMKFL